MLFFGWMEARALVCLRVLMAGGLVAAATAFAVQTRAAETKFEVSFPAAVHAEKITGRVFVFFRLRMSRNRGSRPTDWVMRG